MRIELKTVLTEAVYQLTKINMVLMEKAHKSKTQDESEKYFKEIARNNSIILDYNFRLKYE